MKDHIVQQTQKTFKHGKDMADSIRNGQNVDSNGCKPVRDMTSMQVEDDEGNETAVRKDNVVLRIKQDGHDLEFTEELRQCNITKSTFEDNKSKACALTHGCCNKAMQNGMQEHPNF